MNLMLLRTGKANADQALSECYAFYTPRPAIEGDNCIETFVGKAARDFRSRSDAPIKEHGGAVVVPSLSGFPEEIGGQFATATYNIREGVIIKLMAKKRVGWNTNMSTAIMFLKSRSNAALRCVRFAPVPNNALSMDWLGIQGRFDQITLAEAEAFGAVINPATRRLSELNDEGVFSTLIMEEEAMAPVTMVAIPGTDRVRPVIKRRRKIEEI